MTVQEHEQAHLERRTLHEAGAYQPRAFTVPADDPQWTAHEEGAQLRAVIAVYLLAQMEPTDRALRPYGSVYPADGSRPELRADIAMPGSDPYDGGAPVPPTPVLARDGAAQGA